MNNTPAPDQPEGVVCGSCGRFVGALTRCPHCGARVEKRLSVRVFRYAALLLATVGLGLLYVMARMKETPVIRIGELKPTMNFAYVKVAGTVSGDARLFKEGNRIRTLRFMVDDGSGEIMVTAYRAQAEALAAQDRIPRMGDRVEVIGTIAMTGDDTVSLRLQVPEQLVLSRTEMPVTPLRGVTAALVGGSIAVEGTIVRVNAPRPESRAPWLVTISDGDAEREIMFWDTTYAEIPDKMLVRAGSRVRARVSVKTYRDQIQLSVNRGTDLEFPSGAPAAAMTAGPGAPSQPARQVALGDVTAAMTGQFVEVSGRVAEVRTPEAGSKAPYTVLLQEGDRKLAVVYWDVVARHLGQKQPVVGGVVKAQGWVGLHRDQVQVKVTHSTQIALVEAAPAAAKAAPAESLGELAIGAVTAEAIGKECTLRGTLGEPRSVRGGVIYPLTDGEKRISLVLWDRSVPGPDRDRLGAGVRVTVTGVVRDYRGSLEIVPASAQAIGLEP